MAHHKDAIKRMKQSAKRRLAHRHYRTRMRNQIRRVRAAIETGDKSVAQTEFQAAVGILHRVASKGIIHRNQAARKISRLSKAIKAL